MQKKLKTYELKISTVNMWANTLSRSTVLGVWVLRLDVLDANLTKHLSTFSWTQFVWTTYLLSMNLSLFLLCKTQIKTVPISEYGEN